MNKEEEPLIEIYKTDIHYLEKRNPFESFDNQFLLLRYDKKKEKREHQQSPPSSFFTSVTHYVEFFFLKKDRTKKRISFAEPKLLDKESLMRFRITTFYNNQNLWQDIPKNSTTTTYYSRLAGLTLTTEILCNLEFNQFLKYHFEIPHELEWIPFRTEWKIFDFDLKIEGTVDMLYKSPTYHDENNKELIMVNWKRSKEIKYSNPHERALHPISNLPNANYYKYSIQLSMYKKIIEKNSPYKISMMFLAIFHPNFTNYQLLIIPDMIELVDKIWNE